MASYRNISILGKVVSSRLTFAKSNEELDPILVRLTKLRTNMRLPEVKRYQTNNATRDRNLWKKYIPELPKNILEYIPPNSNLGFTSINDKDCIFISWMNTLNNWSMSIISSIDTSVTILVEIDCERSYRDNSAKLTRIL